MASATTLPLVLTPVTTLDVLLEHTDELCRVLDGLSPSEAQNLACANHRCLKAVVVYVSDHGGLRKLWRLAWPSALVAHRRPSKRDWSRTVVHASWAIPKPAQRRFATNEEVCIDIDPPASVGEVGLMMAWRVSIEWRASVGHGPMQRYASALGVIDARDGRLGISHSRYVPCAHRLASDSVLPFGDTAANGLMRAMGWLSHAHSDSKRRLRLMAETRCDGSLFLKATIREAVGENTITSLPHVRILPSSDLRAVFWLYSRALGLPLSGVPPPRAPSHTLWPSHTSPLTVMCDADDGPMDRADRIVGANETAPTGVDRPAL